MMKLFTKKLITSALLLGATTAFAQTITYKATNKFQRNTAISSLKPKHSDTTVVPDYVSTVQIAGTGAANRTLGVAFNGQYLYTTEDLSTANSDLVRKVDLSSTSPYSSSIIIKDASSPVAANEHSVATPTGIATFNTTVDGNPAVGFYIVGQAGGKIVKATPISGGGYTYTDEVTGLSNPAEIIKIPNSSPEAYYISNRNAHKLIYFTPSAPTKTTDVNITGVILNRPTGMSFDENDNLYLLNNDGTNGTANQGKALKLTFTDATTATGTEASNFLGNSFGVAYANGFIYVTHYGNHAVYKINPNTKTTITTYGTSVGADNGIATAAKFNQPFSAAFSPTDGNIYLGERTGAKVRKLSLNRYVVDPALPAGLTIDEMTGEISGTPTALSTSANYTVKLVNSQGTTVAQQVMDIEVVETLPVTLKSFEAKKQNNGNINISWTTSAETNNNRFELSKSTDGVSFSNIATRTSLGNQGGNYQFADVNPATGANYYKLVQIDNNGTKEELGLKVVDGSLTNSSWTIYPNPSNGQSINIKYSDNKPTTKEIKIYNAAGQLVIAKKVTLNGQTNVALSQALSPGFYTIAIQDLGMQKIIVE